MMPVDLHPKGALKDFSGLRIREADRRDHSMLARMNLHLRQDEGIRDILTLKDMAERFERFQTVEGYTVEIFMLGDGPVGFINYRIEADDSSNYVSRVYIRQFFIKRDKRHVGLGRACLEAREQAQHCAPGGLGDEPKRYGILDRHRLLRSFTDHGT